MPEQGGQIVAEHSFLLGYPAQGSPQETFPYRRPLPDTHLRLHPDPTFTVQPSDLSLRCWQSLRLWLGDFNLHARER